MKHSATILQRVFLVLMPASPVWLSGCPKPGPRYFPPAPLRQERVAPGWVEYRYDLSGNGRADYAERLGPEGRVVELRFDDDGDGEFERSVDRARPQSGDAGETRHLLLILDSIPFELLEQLRAQGHFRHFYAPSRVISTFPVMTDPALAEFFGVSPCNGVESAYYDEDGLTEPFNVYVNEENAPWMSRVDYRLPPVAHVCAYTYPVQWYDHELGRIEEKFLAQPGGDYVAYSVGTSALGTRNGRNGHVLALQRADRFCQSLMHRLGGKLEITIMSDHGHNLVPSAYMRLTELLKEMGYRVTQRVKGPRDVAIPEYAIVTCASIYTQAPAAVAADVIEATGVDLAMYRDGEEIVVIGRTGRARIAMKDGRYRYAAEFGDPLRLGAIWERLRAEGQVDGEGYASDRVLLGATHDHFYPDPLHRIWRAFHGLFVHTPDVIVSIEDGWHCGRPVVSNWLKLASAHGNLNLRGSCGVVMSTYAPLPPVVRMEELYETIQASGFRINEERVPD